MATSTCSARLADAAQLAGPTEASVAAEAATRVLREHVNAGEIKDALSVLPTAVRVLLEPSEAEEAT